MEQFEFDYGDGRPNLYQLLFTDEQREDLAYRYIFERGQRTGDSGLPAVPEPDSYDANGNPPDGSFLTLWVLGWLFPRLTFDEGMKLLDQAAHFVAARIQKRLADRGS